MTRQLTEQQAEKLRKAEWARREYRGLPEGANYHNLYKFAKALAQRFGNGPFDGAQTRDFCRQQYSRQVDELYSYWSHAPITLYEKGILARTPHPAYQSRFFYSVVPEALMDLERLVPQVKQPGTKRNPEMDAVIDRGGTLKEISIAKGVTRQWARQYIGATKQYDKWIRAKQAKKGMVKTPARL